MANTVIQESQTQYLQVLKGKRNGLKLKTQNKCVETFIEILKMQQPNLNKCVRSNGIG